jgi:sarcosine oxidase
VNQWFDTIVAGLGAIGSAASYQLAKRGARVLGIDRFSPPHAYGSSHGETRITRLAIGEGTHYTPLAMRSHEIWREIEQATARELLVQTGGLIISGQTNTAAMHVEDFFDNTVRAAERYAIPHELLDAAAIRRRFPAFNVQDNEVGYYEPSAGYLRPEACVAAQCLLAERHGAELKRDETILAIEDQPEGVLVHTSKGTYRARTVVLSIGPWLRAFLDPSIAQLFKVTRQVLFWFEPRGAADIFQVPEFPVYIWEPRNARQAVYGFPAVDGKGVKVASGAYGPPVTPEDANREVSDDEIDAMYREVVQPHFPNLSGTCLKAVTCLYTVTPDSGFVIDRSTRNPNVLIASVCSGHGFKHSAAVGEAIAEQILDGRSRLDLSPFKLSRFDSTRLY